MPSFTAHGYTSELPCTCEHCWAESKLIPIACQACGEVVLRGDLEMCWPQKADRSYLMCPDCRDGWGGRERWILVPPENGGRAGLVPDTPTLQQAPSVRLRPSGLTRAE